MFLVLQAAEAVVWWIQIILKCEADSLAWQLGLFGGMWLTHVPFFFFSVRPVDRNSILIKRYRKVSSSHHAWGSLI